MNTELVKASYRRDLKEIVTIRRYTGSGANRPRFDAENIAARVAGYTPHELIGTIIQGDRKIIVLVDDLIQRQFALPVTTNDKVVVEGKELAIIAVDGSTRKVDDVLIAYELQARG